MAESGAAWTLGTGARQARGGRLALGLPPRKLSLPLACEVATACPLIHVVASRLPSASVPLTACPRRPAVPHRNYRQICPMTAGSGEAATSSLSPTSFR